MPQQHWTFTDSHKVISTKQRSSHFSEFTCCYMMMGLKLVLTVSNFRYSWHILKKKKLSMIMVLLYKIWKTEVAQLCPTPCDPWCRLPGSSVHGIFQAGTLEWVAISFSRGSSQSRDQIQISALQVDSLPPEPWGKIRKI